jgi:nicotinamidase-related amidase
MVRVAPQNNDLHGNVPDACPVALLLLDVLNDLDFPGAGALLRLAPTLAKNIAALKARCREAGIPAVYVNDNREKWRSDSSSVIRHCLRATTPGRVLVEPLVPCADDYIVLKPKHSAFYATPLDTLLSYLQTKTVILVGLTTDACILTTACEIHIRDLGLFIPSDCVAALDDQRHSMAMELMTETFGARLTSSRRLNLKKLLGMGNILSEGRRRRKPHGGISIPRTRTSGIRT